MYRALLYHAVQLILANSTYDAVSVPFTPSSLQGRRKHRGHGDNCPHNFIRGSGWGIEEDTMHFLG